MLEKGIVISPDFTFDGRNLQFKGLSGQTMRQCLLYWDKVEFPTSNLINIGTGPDLHFLIDSGVLQRTDIRLDNFVGNIGYGVIDTQIEAFKRLNEQEPGQWSLAQSSNQICLSQAQLEERQLLEFELHNCMPIPTSDVPYEDILEFKLQRQDEYVAFKELAGELYLEIVNSNDIPRTKNHVMNRLQQSIKDIDAVSSESFAKRIYKSFSIGLNPANMAVQGMAGIGAATLFGMPVELGAAAGSVMGSMNFNLSNQAIPAAVQQNQKGLTYLLQAHSELGGKIGRNQLCLCGSGKKYKKCCSK